MNARSRRPLARLRDLGILNWVRRCAEHWRDGRFVLEQETNAYAVLPESQWRGYRPPQEPPAAPWPEAWGAPALPCPSCDMFSAVIDAAGEDGPTGVPAPQNAALQAEEHIIIVAAAICCAA